MTYYYKTNISVSHITPHLSHTPVSAMDSPIKSCENRKLWQELENSQFLVDGS